MTRSTPISTIEIILACANGITAILLGGGLLVVMSASWHLKGIERELQNGVRGEIHEVFTTYKNLHSLFHKFSDRLCCLEDLETISKELGRSTEQRMTAIEKRTSRLHQQQGDP